MGNTELPKQFLLNNRVDRVLICCPKEWMSYTRDTIKKYILDLSRIDIVEGGKTRNDTILNGCSFIDEHYGINDDDIILTHDAVRPFLNQRIIDDK